jgi:hypothetical protein
MSHLMMEEDNDTYPRATEETAEEGDPKSFANLVTASFPKKLFDLVTTGDSDVVRWEEHGKAFRITSPERFAEEVLPLYFRHSKLTSFQRQLNLYGFRRVKKGEDKGSYYHEKFQRGKPNTALEIRRLPGKVMPTSPAPRPAPVIASSLEQTPPDFGLPLLPFMARFLNEPIDDGIERGPDLLIRLSFAATPLVTRPLSFVRSQIGKYDMDVQVSKDCGSSRALLAGTWCRLSQQFVAEEAFRVYPLSGVHMHKVKDIHWKNFYQPEEIDGIESNHEISSDSLSNNYSP